METSPSRANRDIRLILALAGIVVLAAISLALGVYGFSIRDMVSGEADVHASMVLLVSRIPRTVAIILVGASTSITGMIMQMLARNRFVSPSTAGTVESASLGILIITLMYPGAAMGVKIGFASVVALLGTGLFLLILRQVPLRSPLVVPLIGMMLGGVISSITSFFAYRYDLLQSLSMWTNGDFSRVLRGRYELLWLSGALTVIAFFAADRFTVAGLGEAFTKNLGLNYGRVVALGLTIVSLVTAVNVVTVGSVPFIGLVVPNVVNLAVGDNLRRSIPWVAVVGASFVLACDLIGRLVRYPYEVPIGTVIGVLGAAAFLAMLLRSSHRVG